LAPVSKKADDNATAIGKLQEKDLELAGAIDGKVSNSTFTDYQSSVSTALGKKADKDDVDAQLALKATATDVAASLATKSDITTHNADKKILEDAIALKADKTTITGLETDLNSKIDKKADITVVNKKADMVVNATNGNFAGLDANGNLTDSGKNANSFDAAGAAAAVLGKSDDAAGAATVHGVLNKVTEVNGKVSNHDTAIQTLNGEVAKKADKSAVDTLSSTVGGHTTTIAEHGTKIQNLEGSVAGLQSTKASASDLSNLQTEVQTLTGTVASNKAAAEQALNQAITDLNMSQYQTTAAAKNEHDALAQGISEAKSSAQAANTAAANNAAAIAAITDGTNGILAQAKAHADELDEAMDERVAALEQLTTGGTGSIAEQIATAVAAEKTAREAADTTLDGKINKNATDISNMDTAYKAADTALGGRIDVVAGNLATETAAREKLDTDLRALITAEETRAQNAEKGLADEIAAVDAALKLAVENNTEGMDSIKELATWVNTHGSEAEGMTNAIEKNADDIAQEIADRKAAITGVNSAIESANGKITGLETRMGTAEGKITNLETAANAVAGQISTAVDAEKTRAEAAEKKLTDDLQSEVTARTNAVNTINTNIGTVPEGKNLVGMISAAEAAAKADAESKINPLAARVKAIEDDYLTEADKTELAGLITDEATARASGDAATLQSAKDYTDSKLTWNAWGV
jgi:chromosome segregation ATPase